MTIRILNIMTNSMGYTGVSTSVMNYYNFMDKSGLQIDFVVPNKVDDKYKIQVEKNGGKIYELFNRDKKPFRYMRDLLKIMKAGKYDIVHAHGNSCILLIEMAAAKMEGVKIRIAHSRNTACNHRVLNKLLRPFFDISYTHGFACGTDAGKWLFKNKPFTVITNGNDIKKFSYHNLIRQEYRQKYGLEGKKVIGHVGSFNIQKNHEFLVETFAELIKLNPNCILFLIGDGELRNTIEKKVKINGMEDKVIFIGKTPEVPSLLQAMDLMVLPSRFEGFPNVVVEWQIACLPSLLSDQITKEVKITDLVQFLSLEKGAKAWAERINEIEIIDRQLISEGIQEEIRTAGYDITDNAKELKKLYISYIQNETYQ